MVMDTIICKVSLANYGSREDVVMSLNDLTDIKAEYKSTGIGQGEIHIQVPNNFTLADALGLGQYIGQIQTMSLM
jgi:hypothetical protein